MDVRGLRALLCVVLVVTGCSVAMVPFASAAATDVGGADAGTGAGVASLQEDETDTTQEDEDNASQENESLRIEDADEIHIDVHLHENGSASFTVTYRYAIDEENESYDRWQSLRDDIESNPGTYTDAESEGWEEVAADGENATDREMNLSNFSVTTDESSAPRNLGQVQFRFQWSSFAHVELNQIEAGDALSGFTLVDGTTLQITWPDGYTVYEVDPPSDDRPEESVFWDGAGTEFTDDQPRLVLIENGESTEGSEETEEGPSMPWLAVFGALALLASVGVAGWWIRRDGTGPPASVDDEATRIADGVSDGATAGPPPELLSNEERVLRLLEERGGRIKQQEVVSELDWTEAKTSQVVSGLREDDEIEVFRIGRENVLAFPDDESEE